jgi:phage tail sheath protein FI
MAIAPTYPGVYLQEIPSGVRTIVGVSTSVTAFVGTAKRGPVNRAVRIFGFAEFERRFGGLSDTSEMSYAVRQFFLNGGAEALIVRVAKDPLTAWLPLLADAGNPASETLRLTALDQGKSGENISVRVDYATVNPASTFNLTITYANPDNPSDSVLESFANLSMNRQDPRYVINVVNDTSRLVKAERRSAAPTGQGTSTSASITSGFGDLIDATHKILYVQVDGKTPAGITLTPSAFVDLDAIASAIDAAVAAQGEPKLAATVDGDSLVLTSASSGEGSSIRVLQGGSNDASARLKLGTANGGVEQDAAARLRPVESTRGSLTSGVLTGTPPAPSSTQNRLRLSLDGAPPISISLPTGPLSPNTFGTLAERIESSVRAARQAPSFLKFTAEFDTTSNKLVLTSGGLPGAGSSVAVDSAPDADIAAALHFVPGQATSSVGRDAALEGGQELDFNEDDALDVYIGSRSDRAGIYALESIPIFNILCLPGVTHPTILSEVAVYCQERRAFLIADPKLNLKPDQMASSVSGTDLPKSDSAAVYYPWIRIGDPLRGGKPRSSAPCGTVAGVFARTDAARGVWKAPAGTDATLAGVLDLDYPLTDPENGLLNPLGVNALRIFPVFGAISWGARTLRGADQLASDYKYVPVRRLALFIEQSLYLGTQWAVFEPNDEPLWAQLRLAIGSFMQDLFRQGAFQGKTPSEAYFVKSDKETTTQNDINLGIVNVLVGFAPLKPAEFVVLRIQQLAGQIQV